MERMEMRYRFSSEPTITKYPNGQERASNYIPDPFYVYWFIYFLHFISLLNEIYGFIVMPSINLDFLNLLQDDYKKYNCFIETGTASGETIFAVEPYFEKLYTIEFSEKYYNDTKNNYSGSKINFILGDSAIELKHLLPSITDKCIIFLDGHWSSGDTGRSNKDCPLDEEITNVNNLFTNEAIIIDDFRLFGLDQSSGKLGEDWSKINKENLLNILQLRIHKVYHLNSTYANDDRLIIHINAKLPNI